ncbi:MAG: hypothetical protein E6R13_04030 [Spirochaetes bacterium]|nr:MAG: hypothetical protein E6R13_04030 [Spirochaetota bacterium]
MSLTTVPIKIVVPENINKEVARLIVAAVTTTLATTNKNHSVDPNTMVVLDQLKSTLRPKFCDFRVQLTTTSKDKSVYAELEQTVKQNQQYKTTIVALMTDKKETVLLLFRKLLQELGTYENAPNKQECINGAVSNFAEMMQIIETDTFENDYTLDELKSTEFFELSYSWIMMYFVRCKLGSDKVKQAHYAKVIVGHLVDYYYIKLSSGLN